MKSHAVMAVRAALAALAGVLLLCSCATTGPHYRCTQDFKSGYGSVGTVGLVKPVVIVSEIQSGGQLVPKADWSQQGQQALEAGVAAALAQKGLKVVPIPADQEDVKQLRERYEGLAMLMSHAFDKPGALAYSLAPVEAILDRFGVDALVMVSGREQVSSGGRIATGILLQLVFGATQQQGTSWVDYALVDRQGRVVWFDLEAVKGDYDLRKADSAASFSVLALQHLPPH